RKSGVIRPKDFLKKSLDSPDARPYSPAPVAVVKATVTGVGIGRLKRKRDNLRTATSGKSRCQ
ncbi:MAG TPA: hypothetical protein VF611_10120, partial [Pyrinomonadaceae bacterium]